MQKIISQSVKKRQGHLYTIDPNGHPKTILDKPARHWKQVVDLEETGMKKKNGKPALRSVTKHLTVS